VREVLGLSGGRLDIVAQTTLAVDPLAAMVGRFARQHPKVGIRVTDPERGSEVGHLVRTGQCELGLVNAAVPTPELDGIDLAEQQLVLVLPPRRPESEPPPRPGSGSGPVRLADLAALRLVATPDGTEIRDVLAAALLEVGLTLDVAVETAHRAMIVPLVLAGAGASLLPRPMAEDAAGKGALLCATEPALSYRGRLVWRSGPRSPAADRFVEMAREHYAAR
jgi:DNA-binding transcriptional LysR family regulator